MGILYVVPFYVPAEHSCSVCCHDTGSCRACNGNLILIGYIMDFSATIYRQKKENLRESMDEEQIQQIEQAKDKMKDNFLT